MESFTNLYFYEFLKNNCEIKKIEEIEINNNVLYFNVLYDLKEYISVTLESICYVDLCQFNKKGNIFNRKIIINNHIPINIYLFNKSKDLDIIAYKIKSIIKKNINKNVIYNKTYLLNFYCPKNHILQINNNIDKYIKEHDTYYDNMKKLYEDNPNGICQKDLDLIPTPQDVENSIKIINLDYFILNVLVNHNHDTKISKNKYIIDVYLLLKIENINNVVFYKLEWYIDKILINNN